MRETRIGAQKPRFRWCSCRPADNPCCVCPLRRVMLELEKAKPVGFVRGTGGFALRGASSGSRGAPGRPLPKSDECIAPTARRVGGRTSGAGQLSGCPALPIVELTVKSARSVSRGKQNAAAHPRSTCCPLFRDRDSFSSCSICSGQSRSYVAATPGSGESPPSAHSRRTTLHCRVNISFPIATCTKHQKGSR